jgi:integrase/recombinase XerC
MNTNGNGNGTKHRGGLAPDKYLSAEELDRLREFVRARAKRRKSRAANTDFLIIEILAGAGLRASELCALQIQDCPCHHQKPVLYVRDGKGNVSRAVDIPNALGDSIAFWVANYRQDQPPEAPLIAAPSGKAIQYETVYRKVRRIGEEMKMPDRLHPHRLRHTYGTALYAVEKDLNLVAQQLGHADINTTTIYAKTSPESARRQVEKLFAKKE